MAQATSRSTLVIDLVVKMHIFHYILRGHEVRYLSKARLLANQAAVIRPVLPEVGCLDIS